MACFKNINFPLTFHQSKLTNEQRTLPVKNTVGHLISKSKLFMITYDI